MPLEKLSWYDFLFTVTLSSSHDSSNERLNVIPLHVFPSYQVSSLNEWPVTEMFIVLNAADNPGVLQLADRWTAALQRRRLPQVDAGKMPRLWHRPRLHHGQVAAGKFSSWLAAVVTQRSKILEAVGSNPTGCWAFFLIVSILSVYSSAPLIQVPHGGATLPIFLFKNMLSFAAWGKETLLHTDWAKKVILLSIKETPTS